MKTMTVETLVNDEQLYNIKFLADAPFDPPEMRGRVMGLIGKLRNDPEIPEETPEDERDMVHRGLKPSERKASLDQLFRTLFPAQGHETCHKLMMAIHEELVSLGINMFDVLAAEEEKARQVKEQREAERAKREAEREARRSWEEKRDEFHDYVVSHGNGPPSEEGYSLGRALIESGNDFATAAHEVVYRNLVIQSCYMCEKEVPANTLIEVEDEMMCRDCAQDWGVEIKDDKGGDA